MDGYENSDEDLVALNRVLTDPEWKPDPAKAAAKTSNLVHIQSFRLSGANPLNAPAGHGPP